MSDAEYSSALAEIAGEIHQDIADELSLVIRTTLEYKAMIYRTRVPRTDDEMRCYVSILASIKALSDRMAVHTHEANRLGVAPQVKPDAANVEAVQDGTAGDGHGETPKEEAA